MKRELFLLSIARNLFEGGAAAGAGAAAAGAGGGDAGTGETNSSPAAAAQGNSGDLSKVVYGKQPSGATGSAAAETEGNEPPAAGETDTLEARQAEFDELIRSDRFKDIYEKRTQKMIDRRFAKSKAVEAENGQLREIAEKIGQKYGITDFSDLSQLSTAIDNDDDIWRAAADEAGLSVPQYREFEQMRRERDAYAAARENDVRSMQQRAQAQQWQQEAMALKEKYPQFDLSVELGDRNFVAAMRSGVPMELIYTGKYHDALLAEATQSAAKTTEKRVVDNIRAKGKRPAENGTASQSAAFTVKSDPSKLTLDDFNEIARRVAHGEKITF